MDSHRHAWRFLIFLGFAREKLEIDNLLHDVHLVTRNERDFPYPRLIPINPWRA